MTARAASELSHPDFSTLNRENSGARQRHDVNRQPFVGFIADAETANAVRAALTTAFPSGLILHRANFREALTALRGAATPETVLIDLSGEDQPLTAMVDLEAAVDPGTRILALGNRRDVGFYRSLTRSLGVKEYLPKPVTSEAVARDFLPWVLGTPPVQDSLRGGTIIAVSGVRGGIGTTTVASNLAWLIGAEMRRHTILVDTDLQMGSTALMLGSQPSSGLRTALETPDRIDPLLIERAAQPIAERLHVLAAEEPMNEKWSYIPGAAAAMDITLRQRYNFIVVDVPLRPLSFGMEMQALAHHVVLVMDPTSISLRNAQRYLKTANGKGRGAEPVLLLNRSTRNDNLSAAKIEQELGMRITATIPDLGRLALHSANLGEMMVAKKNKFRGAIVAVAQAVGATAEGDASR